MRPILVSLIVVVAACGGGDGGTGPTGEFDCLGDPLPTTAANPITVSGQVQAGAFSPGPLDAALVTAFATGTAESLAVDTSDAGGAYSLTVATGGVPLNGYVRVQKGGYITTYGYPAVPLVASAIQNVLVPTSGEIDVLEFATDVTQGAGNGFIGVVVVDCAGDPIQGATVATTPAGTVRYNNSASTPSPSATSTAADGVAYVFNVAAGNVLVSATGGGHVLRAHTVNARADAVTLTEVKP
jgi:hypothetical protein